MSQNHKEKTIKDVGMEREKLENLIILWKTLEEKKERKTEKNI